MLPRGPLSKKQLTKLKIYVSDNHPHVSQKIENIDFGKINKKNIRNN
jgi:large subunit ribosomal protein L13